MLGLYPDFFFFLYCRRVISAPYSRVVTSRWYGHRVCNVHITVSGPIHLLQEVQVALGKNNNFTVLTTDGNGDNKSTDQQNTDNDTVADNDIAKLDSDSTRHDTDCDDDYNLSNDTITYESETDTDTTKLDTTPLLIRPDRQTSTHRPGQHMTLRKRTPTDDDDATPLLRKRQQQQSTPTCHTDDDTSDSTPLLEQVKKTTTISPPHYKASTEDDITPLLQHTATKKHRQQPKQLFKKK